jgi:gas vesicle protein
MAQIYIKQAAVFLFTGVVAGAAIALLYAPQSGAGTTKDIKKFARKTVRRLDDLQGDVSDQVAGWVDDMTGGVKDAADRGKKPGEEGYEKFLQGFDNAKESVEGGRNRIEQFIQTT